MQSGHENFLQKSKYARAKPQRACSKYVIPHITLHGYFMNQEKNDIFLL